MIKKINKMPDLKVGDIFEVSDGSLWLVTAILEIEQKDNDFTEDPVMSFKVFCKEVFDNATN